MVPAPPDICALRFITTIPWCSKVSGHVVMPSASPARQWQESWVNARDCHPAGEGSVFHTEENLAKIIALFATFWRTDGPDLS